MKKIIMTLVLLFIAGSALANPPRSVDIVVVGRRIDVTAIHPVGDNKLHYIDKIDVYLNGEKRIRQTFAEQAGDEIKLVYLLPSLKDKDTVMVKATCNKYGEKSAQVIVGEQKKR